MKIQCDVCGKEEASIFCCADEAALCDACDFRVHKANKLAEKHHRFSLSSGQAPPVCDVCQDKRGYIFCQEDRAILCKECDEPIHGANNLTMKHNRFLLAGARLSVHPLSNSDFDPTSNEEYKEKKKEIPCKINKEKDSGVLVTTKASVQTGNPVPGSGVTTSDGSSISEYLTKVCPGWHVEDLLVDDAAIAVATVAAAKGNQLAPFMEADLESGSFDPPMWVPQPFGFTTTNINQCQNQNSWIGSIDVGPTFQTSKNCWNNEDLFMVPQMPPRKTVPQNKRARSSFLYY